MVRHLDWSLPYAAVSYNPEESAMVNAVEGLPGTALFLAFLASVLRMKVRVPGSDLDSVATALKWGCVATLSCEILIASTPNLGVFFFAMAGLATGLARSTQR